MATDPSPTSHPSAQRACSLLRRPLRELNEDPESARTPPRKRGKCMRSRKRPIRKCPPTCCCHLFRTRRCVLVAQGISNKRSTRTPTFASGCLALCFETKMEVCAGATLRSGGGTKADPHAATSTNTTATHNISTHPVNARATGSRNESKPKQRMVRAMLQRRRRPVYCIAPQCLPLSNQNDAFARTRHNLENIGCGRRSCRAVSLSAPHSGEQYVGKRVPGGGVPFSSTSRNMHPAPCTPRPKRSDLKALILASEPNHASFFCPHPQTSQQAGDRNILQQCLHALATTAHKASIQLNTPSTFAPARREWNAKALPANGFGVEDARMSARTARAQRTTPRNGVASFGLRCAARPGMCKLAHC